MKYQIFILALIISNTLGLAAEKDGHNDKCGYACEKKPFTAQIDVQSKAQEIRENLGLDFEITEERAREEMKAEVRRLIPTWTPERISQFVDENIDRIIDLIGDKVKDAEKKFEDAIASELDKLQAKINESTPELAFYGTYDCEKKSWGQSGVDVENWNDPEMSVSINVDVPVSAEFGVDAVASGKIRIQVQIVFEISVSGQLLAEVAKISGPLPSSNPNATMSCEPVFKLKINASCKSGAIVVVSIGVGETYSFRLERVSADLEAGRNNCSR